MKKLFIKLLRLLGYEIIDQNKFTSPTLNKELNSDLSTLNKKSIILPLGEVKISRHVKSILIILRMNTGTEIWDQNKKIISTAKNRIFLSIIKLLNKINQFLFKEISKIEY